MNVGEFLRKEALLQLRDLLRNESDRRGKVVESRTSNKMAIPYYDRVPNKDFYSDCDSEGNDPPEATFTDPNTVDEVLQPPPRTNQPINLPFSQPSQRRRLREQFESKVSYEDWIENETGGTALRGGRREVKKLEDDSDFPIGRPYFWHAFCHVCHMNYYPHVPGMWMCTQCKSHVWQQPDDPESKNCGICRRTVAPIRMVGTAKIRNPLTTNAHMCKRCGRVICDSCYPPVKVTIEEYGYQEPQRVCSKCLEDKVVKPPQEEDFGTLYEEEVGETEETAGFQPFWIPKCNRCNITFGRPPKRWLCTSCKVPVWQPLESQDATTCWICGARFPKVRCHKCGHLVCHTCGAFAQPLVDIGWEHGMELSVCKACYCGLTVRPKNEEFRDEATDDMGKPWPARCPACSNTTSGVPDQWLSKCHRRKAWQPEDHPASSKCAVCARAIAEGTREHCLKCGKLVCLVCSQYREPLPELGFAKALPQIVCKMCFNPRLTLLPDSTDYPYWPPKCEKCGKNWVEPPERWRCPQQCGLVWQNPDSIESKACWTCGKKVNSAVNCRRCGRIVCGTCGSGRAFSA